MGILIDTKKRWFLLFYLSISVLVVFRNIFHYESSDVLFFFDGTTTHYGFSRESFMDKEFRSQQKQQQQQQTTKDTDMEEEDDDKEDEDYANRSRNQSNSNRTHHDRDFDFIFWSERPPTTAKFDTSDIMFVYTYPKAPRSPFQGFQEVFEVDFRFCNNPTSTMTKMRNMMNMMMTTCPEILTLNLTELDEIKEYQRVKDKQLKLYASQTRRIRKNDSVIKGEDFTFVTIWSEAHERHVRIPYPSIHFRSIGMCTPERTCPQRCPSPISVGGRREDYPYLFDSRDRLCKSTHPNALPPNRLYGGSCSCGSTCFTPEATGEISENVTWPWKNETERQFYAPYWNDTVRHNRRIVRQYTTLKSQRTTLPYSTCEARFSCPADEYNGTQSSSSPPPPIASDFGHHLMFFPEAKLIFCGIPKVGITEWGKFLRYTIGAKDYLSLPHFKGDRMGFMLGNLEPSRAMEMLDDPTWTKAVFFRNPLERLVSAYQDKILRKSYTQRVFKIGSMDQKKEDRYILSFPEFVERVTTPATDPTKSNCSSATGLSACTDPHWRPQLMMCGLDYLLPKFDFVGNFNFVAEHTKALLEKVGMWETFGQTFDDGGGAGIKEDICFISPPKRRSSFYTSGSVVSGFNQQGLSVSGGRYFHETGSKNKLDQFYTPELIEKVRKAYSLDFMVWDEISKNPVDDISHGKDLNVVQEYCLKNKNTTTNETNETTTNNTNITNNDTTNTTTTTNNNNNNTTNNTTTNNNNNTTTNNTTTTINNITINNTMES